MTEAADPAPTQVGASGRPLRAKSCCQPAKRISRLTSASTTDAVASHRLACTSGQGSFASLATARNPMRPSAEARMHASGFFSRTRRGHGPTVGPISLAVSPSGHSANGTGETMTMGSRSGAGAENPVTGCPRYGRARISGRKRGSRHHSDPGWVGRMQVTTVVYGDRFDSHARGAPTADSGEFRRCLALERIPRRGPRRRGRDRRGGADHRVQPCR